MREVVSTFSVVGAVGADEVVGSVEVKTGLNVVFFVDAIGAEVEMGSTGFIVVDDINMADVD